DLARSPDAKTLASGDYSGDIFLWDAATGRELRRLTGHKAWVQGLSFSPDGMLLGSAGDDTTVRLWDVASGTELRRLAGHKSYVYGGAFSSDGKMLATTGHDQTVRLWRVDTGAPLRCIDTEHLQNNAVALSPDGRLVVAASVGEKAAQVWDAETGRSLPPFVIPGFQGRVFGLAFSPDGRTLVTGCEDGTV